MAISKALEFERRVTPEEIDGLGHVNNLVYLNWFLEAATAHSRAVGWDMERMLAMGEGWVVCRHEIDYLLPVKPEETVLMRTWVETAERASSERRYEIYRPSDGKKVCCGRTMWVWINYKTGRPQRIPQEVVQAFSAWDPANSSREKTG